MAHYYPKITSPFVRDKETGICNIAEFADTQLEMLNGIKWIYTEKIDGTSTAVYWNGDTFEFYGHTTKSQMQKNVLEYLQSIFYKDSPMENLFEELFEDKCVFIMGEAYGDNIGQGKNYSDAVRFSVFDIYVLPAGTDASNGLPSGGAWLEWDSVKEICEKLGLERVPEVNWSSSTSLITATTKCCFNSIVAKENGKPPYLAEGVIARPATNIYKHNGNLIRTKIKVKDYKSK